MIPKFFIPSVTRVAAGELIEIPIAVTHPGYQAIDLEISYPPELLEPMPGWKIVSKGPGAPGPEWSLGDKTDANADPLPPNGWSITADIVGEGRIGICMFATGASQANAGIPLVLRMRVKSPPAVKEGLLTFAKANFDEKPAEFEGGKIEVVA